MAKNYDEMAKQILNLIGGADNVKSAIHCVTRLRFQVKDKSLVDSDAISKIKGVMGTQWLGEQFQIIIGAEVVDAYKAVCKIGGFDEKPGIDEYLDDKPKKKNLNWVIEQISGAVVPIVTILIATSFISILVMLLEWLGVPEDSGTIQIFNFVASSGMYFLPVFVGYSAAKKFGTNPLLGMLLGASLIYPSFVEAVNNGTSLTMFGVVPVTMIDYSSNFLPILLAVAVMVPVEKFFNRIIPNVLKTIFVPFLTLVVMVPLTYCILGPVASIVGGYLTQGLIWLYETFGFLGLGIITAVCPFFILFGMHMTLVVYAVTMFVTLGYETTVFPAGIIVTFCQIGICLAVLLKTKDKDLKTTSGAALAVALASGTTEPAMFGVTMRNSKNMIALVIAGFVGGCIVGLGHATAYAPCYSSIWNLVAFIPGGFANTAWEVAGLASGFAVAFAIVWFTYKDKEEVK